MNTKCNKIRTYSWVKIRTVREKKRVVDESPVSHIFHWPDINSSQRCEVSHSHWTRHDIMRQTVFKNATSLRSLCATWVSNRRLDIQKILTMSTQHAHVNTHTRTGARTYTNTHKLGLRKQITPAGGWCQREKQTGVIIAEYNFQ